MSGNNEAEILLKRKLGEMFKNDPPVVFSFVLPYEYEEIVITQVSMAESVKAKYLKRGFYLKADFDRLEPFIRNRMLAKEKVSNLKGDLKEAQEDLETAKKDLAFVRAHSNFYRDPCFVERHLERIKNSEKLIPELKEKLNKAKEREKQAKKELGEKHK